MKQLLVLIVAILFTFCAPAQAPLIVQADKPGPSVSPHMWGIFFEDINFGADGGLYAEMIKNRSFEFPMPMTGWKEIKRGGNGKTLIVNREKEKPSNPRYAQLQIDAGSGRYGLSNEGFRGMGIQKGERYNFTVSMKRISGEVSMKIEAQSDSGRMIGEASPVQVSGDWKKYRLSFTATDSASRGRLLILFQGNGLIEMDDLSLFPQHTWKDRPGGLRKDLVQLLADLHPGFLRFPGGCIVEGRDLSNRYQWKNTVGPAEERKLLMNRWNVEFPRRSAPDYYQSFGLGFFEYFQLAEDIGAAPLPIVNYGMACQYNSGELASLSNLDPFLQDALDLVEFANGDVSTRWGKLRASMGHPASFNLQYLGIGNEQWDQQYIERYKIFEKNISQRYPQLKLVAAAGPSPDGPRFEYAWKELRLLHPQLLDEHYYQSPEWFFKNAKRYDPYDRKGPKVFAGEYAAHGKEETASESKNTWISALAEAAFMTGLERNADVVQMASYAPLFAHVDAWQWRPDLIWFDNTRSVATPNYYVQQLYSVYKGTAVVPVLKMDKVVAGTDSLYASAVIDEKEKALIIKIVNAAGRTVQQEIEVQGKGLGGDAAIITLASAETAMYNTLDRPDRIVPRVGTLPVKRNQLSLSLSPMSFTV